MRKYCNMNIVQAYTKFNKHNIILISGFAGSGKSELAKFLSGLFKFKLSSLSEFYYSAAIYDKPENYVELENNTKILNWNNIYKSVNWDNFNTHVNNYKSHGIVVFGFGFPKYLLKFEKSFHINVKINKEKLLENRIKYINANPEKNISTETDKIVLNKIIYPLYLKIRDESEIDKYVNINVDDNNIEHVKDETFSYLMATITKWLDNYNMSIIHKMKYNIDEPYDGKRNINFQGKPEPYDGYYHNKKIRLYDFNEEGIDYPEEFKRKYRRQSTSTSESSKSTSNSDAVFLFTSA